MGQLYIPVEKEINGPWFLGNEELEELDDIFEAINIELTKSFEIDIEEEANKRITKGLQGLGNCYFRTKRAL